MGFKGWVRLGKITFNLKIFEKKTQAGRDLLQATGGEPKKNLLGKLFF